jgi:hypothetical protein
MKNENVIQGITSAILEGGLDGNFEVTVETVLDYISSWHTDSFKESVYDHDRDVYSIYGISEEEVEKHLISLGHIEPKSKKFTKNSDSLISLISDTIKFFENIDVRECIDFNLKLTIDRFSELLNIYGNSELSEPESMELSNYFYSIEIENDYELPKYNNFSLYEIIHEGAMTN